MGNFIVIKTLFVLFEIFDAAKSKRMLDRQSTNETPGGIPVDVEVTIHPKIRQRNDTMYTNQNIFLLE